MSSDDTPIPRLAELIDTVLYWEEGMPVRAMEEILEVGPDAAHPVADALAELADEPDVVNALWLMVLLGRLGDPRTVEDLIPWLVDDEASVSHHWVAADALARLGAASLPALSEWLEGDADENERFWIYTALASMTDSEPAHELLLGALESDPPLADFVAQALASHGRPEDIPRLLSALERVEPWQRVEVEEAIREIHVGAGDEPAEDPDWRLRYRIHPSWNAVEPSWPMIAAILREGSDEMRPDPPPVRGLEEILAEARGEDDDERTCPECGEPMEYPTGLWICPDTAAATPLIQHELLGRVHEDEAVDDLFDVLDIVESDELALREEEPRGRRQREAQNDELEQLGFLRQTCRWAIGQGMEDVGSVCARLLAESLRLRSKYGDPEGFFEGSPAPAGERGAPTLVTRDGEELLLSRAHYRTSDAVEARRRLIASGDFDAEDPAGPLIWVRPEDIDMDVRSIFGWVRFEADRVVLECMSAERLERGRAIMERAAGEFLTHRADTLENPASA